MNKTFPGRRLTIFPRRKDKYSIVEKYPQPSVCIECGNVFFRGRWTGKKMSPTEDLFLTTCPACCRKVDNAPAGDVTLRGEFLQRHRDEIMNRILRIESREIGRHPMEKIIEIKKGDDETAISTSGVHLARRIANGLHRSFKGNLSYSYGKGERSVKVEWAR